MSIIKLLSNYFIMKFAFILLLLVIVYVFFNNDFENFYQFENNMLIFTRLNNTLLKKFNIGSSLILDDNDLKQGYYFPGTDILIANPADLDKDAFVVVTAWNVFDDIKSKLVSRGHRGEIICMQ